mmetsp:Transcript_5436/g.11429  ORF Transcript_5436/g.11429 Transcript_5436/m.11429 type:complete len:1032 (+) Transcript_5436:119-3214(+)|eukprot:CAMPEP_0194306730 /NCGR_PEP_ID=MMETSP0171-20130528/3770_1 /TAXON_ID=218684 /ORGANISM="Corethron pennatum, Strain L29A3" /LENGTH=1031 /DNA_ID=CAMNT_0039058569 /DNA_START=101 /DNA_END=3196 /DNA_ORIENTATION=-
MAPPPDAEDPVCSSAILVPPPRCKKRRNRGHTPFSPADLHVAEITILPGVGPLLRSIATSEASSPTEKAGKKVVSEVISTDAVEDRPNEVSCEEKDDIVDEAQNPLDLPPSIRPLLRSIASDMHGSLWATNYHTLMAYYAAYGDTDVPAVYPSDAALGRWVEGQRRQHLLWLCRERSSMTEERKKCLDALGFRWELSKVDNGPKECGGESRKRSRTASSQKGHSGSDVSQSSKIQVDACHFVEVGSSSVTCVEEAIPLPNVLVPPCPPNEVRNHCKKQNKGEGEEQPRRLMDALLPHPAPSSSHPEDLDDDAINRILAEVKAEDVNFGESWAEKFSELRDFIQEHGHSRLESKITPFTNWARAQRKHIIKILDGGVCRALTPKKILVLEAVGFCWGKKVNVEEVRDHLKDILSVEESDVCLRSSNCSGTAAEESASDNAQTGSDAPQALNIPTKVGSFLRSGSSATPCLQEAGSPLTVSTSSLPALSSVDHLGVHLKKQSQSEGEKESRQAISASPFVPLVPTLKFSRRSDLDNDVIARLLTEIEKKSRWVEMFKHLQGFIHEYGHSKVPTHPKNPLGTWASEQRARVLKALDGRGRAMVPKKIMLLENMGFSWGSAVNAEKVRNHLKDLANADQVRNQSEKSSARTSRTEGLSGRSAVSHRRYNDKRQGQRDNTRQGQRANTRQGQRDSSALLTNLELSGAIGAISQPDEPTPQPDNTLPPGIEELLNDVYLSEEKSGVRKWERYYRSLVAYYIVHGHTEVPFEHAIGHWVSEQRRQMCCMQRGVQTTTNLARKRCLDALAFRWSSSINGKKPIDDDKINLLVAELQKGEETFSQRHTEQWLKQFEKLREFRFVHGHTRVTRKYTWEKNGLFSWVARQRVFMRKMLRGDFQTTISLERIEALEAVDFYWGTQICTEELGDFISTISKERSNAILVKSTTEKFPTAGDEYKKKRPTAAKSKRRHKLISSDEFTESLQKDIPDKQRSAGSSDMLTDGMFSRKGGMEKEGNVPKEDSAVMRSIKFYEANLLKC